MRLFAAGAVAVAGLVALASMSAATGMDRFRGWLDPESDPSDLGWQVAARQERARRRRLVRASASVRASEKWGWLPAAHTDFIFAVVGEELGLIGSLLVLALFAAIASPGMRVAAAHP